MSEEPNTSAKPRAHVLLEAIDNDLTLGWVWCQCAVQYAKALQADDGMANSWLHWGSYIACQREAVMSLARMTDNKPESVSLVKLLNYAEQNPCDFHMATIGDVRKQVKEHRTWLEDHELFKRVRDLRDKVLAHTDKVRLSTPATLMSYNLNVAGLEGCLRDILTVTSVYRSFCNYPSLLLDFITGDVDTDMQYELRIRKESQEYRRARLEANRRQGRLLLSAGTSETEIKEGEAT